jgi:hypothetical protein
VTPATPTEPAVGQIPEPAAAFHVPGLGRGDTDPIVAATLASAAAPAETVDGSASVAAPAATTAGFAPAQDRSWLTMLDGRSPNPQICPFLRATEKGGLGLPVERPDPANRCAALAEAVPQSLRQQELVCLSIGHVNCPRYLRGSSVVVETPAPVVRARRSMSPAMIGSIAVLVMAVSASIGFFWARGGSLTIGPGPAASPSATVAAVVPTFSPRPASPSAAVVATPSPSPTPTPTPTATPNPTPTATPRATPRPTPRATPRSDRYRLLRACGDAPRCWIYTVRSGDNVYSIARYFGVSQDSIYARNSWLRTRGLRAGQQLRLPPPTR